MSETWHGPGIGHHYDGPKVTKRRDRVEAARYGEVCRDCGWPRWQHPRGGLWWRRLLIVPLDRTVRLLRGAV